MTVIKIAIVHGPESSGRLVDRLTKGDTRKKLTNLIRVIQGIACGAQYGSVTQAIDNVVSTYGFSDAGVTGPATVVTIVSPESNADITNALNGTSSAEWARKVTNYLSGVAAGCRRAAIHIDSDLLTAETTIEQGHAYAADFDDIDGGPTLWWQESTGITDATGDAADWTSQGSNALVMSSTAALRPEILTVGSHSVLQFDGVEYFIGESAFTFASEWTAAAVVRVDTFGGNDRIFDTNDAHGGEMSMLDNSGDQAFKWEGGANDLISSGDFADAVWHSVIMRIAKGSGTLRVFVNGVASGTATAGGNPPSSATPTMAAASGGSNAGQITLASWACWNGQASTFLSSFGAIYKRHQALAAELGVTLGG